MRARTEIGQHFLKDKSVLERIIEVADLKSTDLVVEIGPGEGVLTDRLLKLAGKVIVFELDHRMVVLMQGIYDNAVREGRLVIVEGDFIQVAKDYLVDIEEYKVVANIPYQITTPLLQVLIEPGVCRRPEKLVLLVQDEVAKKMAAGAGTSDRGYLSVLCQYYADIRYIMKVKPEAFRPRPKVNSAVICLEGKKDRASQEELGLFRFVKASFRNQRKQLKHTLAGLWGKSGKEVEVDLEGLGLEGNIRAQQLTEAQWVKIYNFGSKS